MKLLVLIIYSDNLPVYQDHLKVWRMYSRSSPSVDVYFMKLSKEHTQPTIDEDIIYIPGIESYQNLPYKFISALEILPFQNYDFILRTNMSSFWVFHNLFPVLEKQPREKLLAGELNGNYISGAGMIFTPDVCELLIKGKEQVYELRKDEPFDDVRISFFLHDTHSIQYTQLHPRRYDILVPENGLESKIPQDIFHFRVKQTVKDEDRVYELGIMENLYKRFYLI